MCWPIARAVSGSAAYIDNGTSAAVVKIIARPTVKRRRRLAGAARGDLRNGPVASSLLLRGEMWSTTAHKIDFRAQIASNDYRLQNVCASTTMRGRLSACAIRCQRYRSRKCFLPFVRNWFYFHHLQYQHYHHHHCVTTLSNCKQDWEKGHVFDASPRFYLFRVWIL